MKWKLKLATILFLTLAIFASGASAAQKYYFVSADATDNAADGSEWAKASSDLWGILNAISKDTTDSYDIYVAKGEYRPTKTGNTVVSTDSFILSKGVRLYGGFKGEGTGTDETASGDRNVVTFRTILSGDLHGIAGTGITNLYHVVLCSADNATSKDITPANTRLDGFTITGGNANGALGSPHRVAGGMYNKYSSPAIENCTFAGNTADGSGGGMYNSYSSPVITNSTFAGNTADSGGGMVNSYSSPVVTNCTFAENTADSSGGGGMNNYASSPVVVNTIFWGNTATTNGHAIFHEGAGTLTLSNDVITAGGVYNSGSTIHSSDIITADPKIVSVDVGGNTTNDPKAVYIYKITEASSAAKRGLPVNTYPNVGGKSVTVPATDQLGTTRPGINGVNAVDIGSYESAFNKPDDPVDPQKPDPGGGGGGGGNPPVDPPAPNPTIPVTPEIIQAPTELGNKVGDSTVPQVPPAEKIAAINESPELRILYNSGEVIADRAPTLGTGAGAKTSDYIDVTADPKTEASAVGLMTKLVADIAGGGTLPPALNGVITPMLALLDSGTGETGVKSARFDIYFPNAQRTALTTAGNAGNIFTMSFTVEGVNQKGDSSVYVDKSRENLVRTTKAIKETNEKFKIKVSNNPNAGDAMKFTDFSGTEFHIKLIATVKAEALKHIKDADYGINDLHNALLKNVKDENWLKYKADIDKLPTAQKDNTTILQGIIDKVNGPAIVLVTGITLNKSEISLKVSETEQLTVVSVTPSTATNPAVTWSSDNTDIATVNIDTGEVEAIAHGTTTITATAADGGDASATCAVEVNDPIPDPKKSSGGGCSAGYAGLGFLAVLLVPLMKGKKKK